MGLSMHIYRRKQRRLLDESHVIEASDHSKNTMLLLIDFIVIDMLVKRMGVPNSSLTQIKTYSYP